MENYEERLNRLKKNSEYHIQDYKDALKWFADYFEDSECEADKNAIETLEKCIDNLEQRMIDCHLLNELRLITDTSGDLDLKAKVKSLTSDFKDCRNELCLLCGKYKNEHEEWCKGCKWEH